MHHLPSIKEMVASGTHLDSTFAIAEYRIPKFNGKMLDFKLGGQPEGKADWNREKGGSFIDWYTKKKAFVPPPAHYKEVDVNYIGRKQPSYSVYKSPRKTNFCEMIEKAEKRKDLGPTTFDPKPVHEKIIGIYGGVGERVTVSESIIMEANNVPASNKYHLPNFVSVIKINFTFSQQNLIMLISSLYCVGDYKGPHCWD